MSLLELEVNGLRNLGNVRISPGPKINIFYGANGAGKTSILEAIYMLGTGKSFRTNIIKKLISDNASEATVFGKAGVENRITTLGIRRGKRNFEIRIDGENQTRRALLAKVLPLMVITPESHSLLAQGPTYRRKFVDWGVFHVEHNYPQIWSDFHKVLKNRNRLLQNSAPDAELVFWSESLVSAGLEVIRLRGQYIEALRPYVETYTEIFFPGLPITLQYRTGLPDDTDFADYLLKSLPRDRLLGRTEYGPHRADLVIRLDGKEIHDRVSRGQQKLLVYILQLAQCRYLKEKCGINTSLLLDDIAAELDSSRMKQINTLLIQEFEQIFVTCTGYTDMPDVFLSEASVFHVEHGNIQLSNI